MTRTKVFISYQERALAHGLLESQLPPSAPGFVGIAVLFEGLIGKTPAKMCGYASIPGIDL